MEHATADVRRSARALRCLPARLAGKGRESRHHGTRATAPCHAPSRGAPGLRGRDIEQESRRRRRRCRVAVAGHRAGRRAPGRGFSSSGVRRGTPLTGPCWTRIGLANGARAAIPPGFLNPGRVTGGRRRRASRAAVRWQTQSVRRRGGIQGPSSGSGTARARARRRHRDSASGSGFDSEPPGPLGLPQAQHRRAGPRLRVWSWWLIQAWQVVVTWARARPIWPGGLAA